MFRLYLADDYYNTICPLLVPEGGIGSAKIKTKVSTAREFELVTNNLLGKINEGFDLKGKNLVLQIDDTRIGLTMQRQDVDYLLAIADIGNGSDADSTFGINQGVNASNVYPVTNLSERLGPNTVFYIRNTKSQNTGRPKYLIKTFDLNFNSLVSDGADTLEKARQRLYNAAVKYLGGLNAREANLIREQSGVTTSVYFSSSLNLMTSKREIPLNLEYRGSAFDLIRRLAGQEFVFSFLTGDVNRTVQTGTLNNLELLNEICGDNLQWREAGLDRNGKTIIEVGNFNLLPVRYRAGNKLFDDIFDRAIIQIQSLKERKGVYEVDLSVNGFVPEGTKVMVNYRDFQTDITGQKIKTFDIQQEQIFEGFSNLELFNL